MSPLLTRGLLTRHQSAGLFSSRPLGGRKHEKYLVDPIVSANITLEEFTMPNKNDFEKVFARLKSVLQPYAKKMDVAQDTEMYYLLNTRHIMKNKQPLCFGGVRLGKAYVSFYLMSVYAAPDLLKSMSPELKKRMQGKSCFTFKEVDEKSLKELAQLTKAGAARFSDGKFIDGLRKLQSAGSKH